MGAEPVLKSHRKSESRYESELKSGNVNKPLSNVSFMWNEHCWPSRGPLGRGAHYYRPQTKFAKVMFLHLSVSHSVHRGGLVLRGACSRGVPAPGGLVWGVPGEDPCPLPGQLLLRVVRFLLECILVSSVVTVAHAKNLIKCLYSLFVSISQSALSILTACRLGKYVATKDVYHTTYDTHPWLPQNLLAT